MLKLIEIEAYETPEGQPTCSTHEGKCQFFVEGRGVWYNHCKLAESRDWLKVNVFGYVMPSNACIVWGQK